VSLFRRSMANVLRPIGSALPAPHREDGDAASAAIIPEPAGPFYLPELDILRFVALLWMFLVHASISFPAYNTTARPRLMWAGFYTVDLFFALSASLLTQLLMREQARRGEIDVRAFYLRRTLRIWPLYFCFVGFAFVLSFAFRNSAYAASFTIPSAYFLGFVFFVGNFVFCRFSSPAVVVTMLWTLSIEEQVYLVLPWLIRKATPRAVILVGIALLVLANLVRIEFAYHFHSGVPVWFNTATHLDSIGIGMLLAAVPRSWFVGLAPIRRILFGATGIGCWLFAINYYVPLVAADTPMQEILSYPVAALGCGAILVAVIEASGGQVKTLWGRFLVYLGKISYGLYVYHGLGITLTLLFCSPLLARSPADPFSLQLFKQFMNSAISLVITFGIAACSYGWLEAPFLRLKEHFTVVASRPV